LFDFFAPRPNPKNLVACERNSSNQKIRILILIYLRSRTRFLTNRIPTGGGVEAIFDNLPTSIEYIRAVTLRALARISGQGGAFSQNLADLEYPWPPRSEPMPRAVRLVMFEPSVLCASRS